MATKPQAHQTHWKKKVRTKFYIKNIDEMLWWNIADFVPYSLICTVLFSVKLEILNLLNLRCTYFGLFDDKRGFKSEGRGGFSKLPKMSAKKTIPGFRKWKFWLFFAFTGWIYFQVLQIGSRSIINQLIKPVNAKKVSIFIF